MNNINFTLCSDAKVSPYARVVATIGPASNENLEHTLKYGTIRINMAFIDSDNYEERCQLIKRIRKNAQNNINIMLDAVGPRVKLGKLPQEGIELIEGGTLKITTNLEEQMSSTVLTTIFKQISHFTKVGEPIVLAEGKFLLEITKIVDEFSIEAKVIKGGLLKKRGINLPKTLLKVPALSDRDRKDLGYLLKNDDNEVDTIALSFVRDKDDVLVLRKYLEELGRGEIKIMAKIETQFAVDNIDEIAQHSDSLMVARGDLWCELNDSWSLPRVTKLIISAGHKYGIPVIAATQTLSSMITNDIPSRAEVDELYFLLTEGSDCIMGSEEFAIGKQPLAVIKAIQIMGNQYEIYRNNQVSNLQNIKPASGFEQFHAAHYWAELSEKVECLVIISSRGYIVKNIYGHKQKKPTVVITNNKKTARYMQQFQVFVVYSDFTEKDNYLQIARGGLDTLGWDLNNKSALLCVNYPQDNCMIIQIPIKK